MASRYDKYKVIRNDDIGDPDYWNGRLRDIDTRIGAVEDTKADLDAVIEEGRTVFRNRVDEVLLPLIQDVEEIAHLGALLTAHSASEIEVSLGGKTLMIDDTARLRFAPAAMVGIVATGDPTRALYASVISYDASSGALLVDVRQIVGGGWGADWTVTVANTTDAAADAAAARVARNETLGFRTQSEQFMIASSAAADTAVSRANQAVTANTAAQTAATTATAKAADASASATSATASAATATAKAADASTSASSAATSASTATTKAGEASTSASSAAASATTATTKAGEASTSATSATASASTATTKAGEATTSASSAATNAATATAKAAEATTGAATATAKAAEAVTARDVTVAAKTDTLAGIAAWGSSVLAPSAVDPATRAGGLPLQVGDQFFKTSDSKWRTWSGTQWTVNAVPLGSEVASVFGRGGSVEARPGDYRGDQIARTTAQQAVLAGADVEAALQVLQARFGTVTLDGGTFG